MEKKLRKAMSLGKEGAKLRKLNKEKDASIKNLKTDLLNSRALADELR